MVNKRGQGLSINAIVLIVLAVIVLVLLIIGFTFGWDSLSQYFKKNNVDTLKKSCELACSTENAYDFCIVERELRIEKDNEILKYKDKGKYTCENLSSFGLGISACGTICYEINEQKQEAEAKALCVAPNVVVKKTATINDCTNIDSKTKRLNIAGFPEDYLCCAEPSS